MSRPPLPPGTLGQISIMRVGKGKVRARARYRDWDGITRPVERTGTSATDARNRLLKACRDRGRTDAAAEITGDTLIKALAEVYIGEIELLVAEGERSPNTLQSYRDRLDNQVLPNMGELRLREGSSVSRVEALLKKVREENGNSTAKVTRTVLSGLFGIAVRHDAIPTNPVRDVSTIRKATKVHNALTLEQVWDLRAKVAANPRAHELDVVDLIDFDLATGVRVGEVCAVTRSALNLNERWVGIEGTVIRITGQGLIIKKPKSLAGLRSLYLPRWETANLQRRLETLPPNPWGVIFPSPAGHLRDPRNTARAIREVLDAAGYEWVTMHTLRRTVATLMDEAGLSARKAADQLGHVKISMTQDNYFGRKQRDTGAADALEAVDGATSENTDGDQDGDEDHTDE